MTLSIRDVRVQVIGSAEDEVHLPRKSGGEEDGSTRKYRLRALCSKHTREKTSCIR